MKNFLYLKWKQWISRCKDMILILLVGATNRNEIFSVFNIVTHCSPLKKPCDQNMIAGGHILTDMATFLEKDSQDPRNALNCILGVYPTDPLAAILVAAHFLQQIRPNTLLSNLSSILNNSQELIVGLRKTYALSRAATDAVIRMVSVPSFVSQETTYFFTKYVKRLEKSFSRDSMESMFLFSICIRKWTASKMSACFSEPSSMLLDAFLGTRPLHPWISQRQGTSRDIST
jgi:hypothetical protein